MMKLMMQNLARNSRKLIFTISQNVENVGQDSTVVVDVNQITLHLMEI